MFSGFPCNHIPLQSSVFDISDQNQNVLHHHLSHTTPHMSHIPPYIINSKHSLVTPRTTITTMPPLPSNHPKSLSSFCSWLEANGDAQVPLPHLCHPYLSPDMLVTGYIGPPRQYNFDLLTQSMFQDTYPPQVDSDPTLVSGHSTGRYVSLVGISLGFIFIMLIIAFFTFVKRRKNNQIDELEATMPTQEIFTMPTLGSVNKKDIPPDYLSVLRMKEIEEEDLPSYNEATENNNNVESDTNINNILLQLGHSLI